MLLVPVQASQTDLRDHEALLEVPLLEVPWGVPLLLLLHLAALALASELH